MILKNSWWVLRGSNPRPSPCKGDALPAELNTQELMAERKRFELSKGFKALTPLAGERLQPLGHLSVTM